MRWRRGPRSVNLEDRRARTGGRRMRAGKPMGLGGLLIIVALSILFRKDLLTVLDTTSVGTTPVSTDQPFRSTPQEEELVDFVSFVLDDVQQVWGDIIRRSGGDYRPAKLVLFRSAVDSACGFAQSAVGPFYCPLDGKVYVDLSFFDDLHRRFGAPGDFAQAYVIAHEIGHHVQALLGIEQQVRQAKSTRPQIANQLSVLMELQADCFAGVWGNSTNQRGLLDAADIEEGLNAAAAIGDDRLQKRSTGYVVPESFTHGSSRQRVEWLRRGLANGDPEVCDTFRSN